MDHPKRTSRRKFLAASGNVIAAGSLAALLLGLARAQAKPMTVGFLYTGVRQDYGWNQAHGVAARQIAKLDGVKLLEQENVPETAEFEKVMESMIRLDGARVLFPTSFGFWPFISGTLWVTFAAMALAVPISVLTAIYLSEYAPRSIREPAKPLMDLLAGIPSVVYGVWGVLMVVPLVGNVLAPAFGVTSSGYATRMLGLFLLLPVLALYGRGLGDYSPELLGLAMGAYGLTQAVMQIPFGRWSDRFGRKPVIAAGLALFALGSLLGALASSLAMLTVTRAVQGAGAVSASVTALLADLTRAEVRTRAMAFIGASIGLSFLLSLVLAPVLDAAIGVPGLFALMLVLALGGIVLLYAAVPAEPARSGGSESRSLAILLELVGRPALRPLYLGVFALHFVMTATFLSVPQALAGDLGIPTADHWQVYLGVFVASLAGTVPLVLATERSRRGPALFLLAVLLLGLAQAGLGVVQHSSKLCVEVHQFVILIY